MNTKQFGQIAESKFVFECSKLGYTVSQPIGDNAHYDFIVDKDNQLFKVQCKSMRKDGDVYRSETHRKTGHKRSKKLSYKGLCDFLFLYNNDDGVYAMLPVEECALSTSLWSRANRDPYGSKIRFVEDYQEI